MSSRLCSRRTSPISSPRSPLFSVTGSCTIAVGAVTLFLEDHPLPRQHILAHACCCASIVSTALSSAACHLVIRPTPEDFVPTYTHAGASESDFLAPPPATMTRTVSNNLRHPARRMLSANSLRKRRRRFSQRATTQEGELGSFQGTIAPPRRFPSLADLSARWILPYHLPWCFLQSYATPGRTAGWRTNDLRPRCRAAEGADNDVSPQPDLANGNEQQPHVSESATNASSRPPPVHISVRHMNARFTARYTHYSPAACRPGCQKPGRDLPRGGGRFLHASKRAPTSTHVQRSRRPARSRSHSPDQSARPDRCIEHSALPSVRQPSHRDRSPKSYTLDGDSPQRPENKQYGIQTPKFALSGSVRDSTAPGLGAWGLGPLGYLVIIVNDSTCAVRRLFS